MGSKENWNSISKPDMMKKINHYLSSRIIAKQWTEYQKLDYDIAPVMFGDCIKYFIENGLLMYDYWFCTGIKWLWGWSTIDLRAKKRTDLALPLSEQKSYVMYDIYSLLPK